MRASCKRQKQFFGYLRTQGRKAHAAVGVCGPCHECACHACLPGHMMGVFRLPLHVMLPSHMQVMQPAQFKHLHAVLVCLHVAVVWMRAIGEGGVACG